jgi:hypothetical protein
MKSLRWLTGCALALACAHERKGVVGEFKSLRPADAKVAGR